MAALYYMKDELQQFYYNEIKKPASLENAVDNFWINLLPDYFEKRDKFGMEQESRTLRELTKQRADWMIRYIRNGSSKKIVLMQDIRKGHETRPIEWEKALDQLTGYLRLVRAEPGQNSDDILYGAINIGTYTRFYEFLPFQTCCSHYVGGDGYNGAVLELLRDEATIHRILTEIVEKTKH